MALTADRVTNVPVPFRQLRMKDAEGALQEGVVGANDLKVSQRAAGANPSVDVAVGACWVQIDTGTRNGLVHVYNDAVANVAINPSDATNPRIDQIGIQYNDTSIPAGTGGNTPTLRYVQGTATAGATLDNRNGAVTTGLNDWLRLADFLVPAGTNSPVTTANIRDRRPWARGANHSRSRTAGDLSPGTGALDSATLARRIECSGVPFAARLHGEAQTTTAGQILTFNLTMDGAVVVTRSITTAVAAGPAICDVVVPFTPAAGSHVFDWTFSATGGAPTIRATATKPLVVEYEEKVRQDASND